MNMVTWQKNNEFITKSSASIVREKAQNGSVGKTSNEINSFFQTFLMAKDPNVATPY